MDNEKQLSNPFSTGGGGTNFEVRIQAAYAVIMLSGGFAPAIRIRPIVKIKLQGRYEGYRTDDLIVFAEDPTSGTKAKLLAQIKHSISITKADKVFADVIKSMWKDSKDPSLFTYGLDTFALITGPISKTDDENARTILEWARYSESASDFLTRVGKALFSSADKQEKLSAFRFHICEAKGSPASDEELWQFMKSFYLIGYDLDMEHGAAQSLLETIIGIYSPINAARLWSQIVEEVGYRNQNAGVLIKETFSSEILDAFRKKEIQTIPAQYVSRIEEEVKAGIEEKLFTAEIAPVFLLGAWDESLPDDKKVVEKMTDTPYRKWITRIQTIALQLGAFVEQRNKKWKFRNRLEVWKKFAPFLYDDHLDRFKDIAVAVLSERDPKFELPKEDCYAASAYGKNRLLSRTLVQGIAEGTALIGTFPEVLTSCSANKAEITAALIVREVLASNDWVVWASLNDHLPMLAEASPSEFLDAIEKKLNDKNNELFESIFSQEGNGIGGWNYITGVLWGLEALAWNPEYLPRVTVLLGQLAEVDPGGSWANRPINSLTTVYLPWFPQTSADIPIRQTAIEALLKECATIGWKVLLTLLPRTHQVCSGSHKPAFRSYIPIDKSDEQLSKTKSVSPLDYFAQVDHYSSLAVAHAKADLSRLIELVDQLPSLRPSSLVLLLEYLSSQEVTTLPDAKKVDIWEKLVDEVVKHRKYSNTEWALPASLVDKISDVADKLTPTSPLFRHRRIFGQHELYLKKGDYEEQERDVADQRTIAVKEILATCGIGGVFEFAKSARYSFDVGLALGRIDGGNQDPILIPEKLSDPDPLLSEVMRGYLWSRFHALGWKWVDNLDKSDWTDQQKADLLVCLPFVKETWLRATTLLGENEELYWKRADARPYQLTHELKEAVKQLLKYGRPKAAIACLDWMVHSKVEPFVNDVCEALLACVSSDEPKHTIDQHTTSELIEWLQNRPDVELNVLAKIEWIFLPLLDHLLGKSPRTLEAKLAEEPAFFCEVIRTVFRSEKEKGEGEPVTQERKAIASQAYTLLFQWRIPPGTKADGTFEAAKLDEWIKEVRRSCEESGHLAIALDQTGKVLAHAPSDPSGLWIHRAVAERLNSKDAEEMRQAFNVEIFNMRGTHGYTGGAEEKAIAESWREKAAAVDTAGYFRFAASLRSLAESYERGAKREETRDPFDY